MSTRPNPLRDAMLGVQQRTAPTHAVVTSAEAPAAPSAKTPLAPSRIGKRSVSGHFEPTVARQLRILAAETDRTSQDLIAEALNDLFRKYDKSAIA